MNLNVQGLPLSLSGVKRILDGMDWSEADDFVTIGAVGAKEVGLLFHININSWPEIFCPAAMASLPQNSSSLM